MGGEIRVFGDHVYRLIEPVILLISLDIVIYLFSIIEDTEI